MSSSRPLARNVLIALALLAPLALAACSSFRPVYGNIGSGGVEDHVFSYNEPKTRIEQIIYADLRLRLGPHTAGPGATRIWVTTVQSERNLTKTAVTRSSTQREIFMVATIRAVGPDGRSLFFGARQATAVFTVNSQGIADQAAKADAEERAARALAESARLAILAALENPRDPA